MSWSEERVDLLKKLWAEGLSASQIASRMGGVTRNAVIGKVHRLGLSGRIRPARPPRPRISKPRFPAPTASGYTVTGNLALKRKPMTMPEPEAEPEPEPVPLVAVELSPGERVTILTLTERTCKWPMGDPTEPDFHFCGHESLTSGPYCRAHSRLAYQAVQTKRKRRSN